MNDEVAQIMFGMTEKELRDMVANSVNVKLGMEGMFVMSILSDVQEMIARDMLEDACQSLNVAKWIMSEYNLKVYPNV